MFHKIPCMPLFWSYKFYLSDAQVQSLLSLVLKALQCIWCHFCMHKRNFMPAQRLLRSSYDCSAPSYLKIWDFARLYVCYKYKNNHLYHLSKEDLKWLSYLDVEYYSFHNNIIGFIIILLVSYHWKVCNENMLPFVDCIFLCSLFKRHCNSQY